MLKLDKVKYWLIKLRKQLIAIAGLCLAVMIFAYPVLTTMGLLGEAQSLTAIKDRLIGKTIVYSTQDNQPSTQNPIGIFKRGVVTLTFDDGWASVYHNALQLMEDYNVNSTQYILSGTFGHPSYLSVKQVEALQAGGHHIASHTVTHPNLTKLTYEQLLQEVVESKTALAGRFGPIQDIASPLGAYNDDTLSLIKQHYRSHRTVEEGFNTRQNLDVYRLKGYNMTPDTTMEELQGLLEAATAQKAWLILIYHQVDDSGSQYSVTTQVFEQHLQLIQQSDLYAATLDQVLLEIKP